MRQMLLRVDDALHAALARRAREQGRSVNALANEILTAAVANGRSRSRQDEVRARAAALGILAPAPVGWPSQASADVYARAAESMRGAGPLIDKILDDERTKP